MRYAVLVNSRSGALEHLLTKMQKMGSTNTQIILNTQLDRNLTLAE